MHNGIVVPRYMELCATGPMLLLGMGRPGEQSDSFFTSSRHVELVKGGTRWYVATIGGINGTASFAIAKECIER